MIAMNRTFTQNNPVISRKTVQTVQKSHCCMRDNVEEAAQTLMDQGWNSGNCDMNVMCGNSQQFVLEQDFT